MDFFTDIMDKRGFHIFAQLYRSYLLLDVTKSLLPDLQGVLGGHPRILQFLDSWGHIVQIWKQLALVVLGAGEPGAPPHFELERRNLAAVALIIHSHPEVGHPVNF